MRKTTARALKAVAEAREARAVGYAIGVRAAMETVEACRLENRIRRLSLRLNRQVTPAEVDSCRRPARVG